jgi:hypothetical protein
VTDRRAHRRPRCHAAFVLARRFRRSPARIRPAARAKSAVGRAGSSYRVFISPRDGRQRRSSQNNAVERPHPADVSGKPRRSLDAADLPSAGIYHEVRIILAGVRWSRAMPMATYGPRTSARRHTPSRRPVGPEIGREALSNSQRRASVPSR